MAMAIADPAKLALRRASRIPGIVAPTEVQIHQAITRATRRERQTLVAQAVGGEAERALKSRVPWAKQLLATKRPFLVWGRPGVGRSWLLQQAARAFEESGNATTSVLAPPIPLNEVGYGGLREVIQRLSGWATDDEVRAGIEGVKTEASPDALEAIFGQGGSRGAAVVALRWAIKTALESSDNGNLVLVLDDVDYWTVRRFARSPT